MTTTNLVPGFRQRMFYLLGIVSGEINDSEQRLAEAFGFEVALQLAAAAPEYFAQLALGARANEEVSPEPSPWLDAKEVNSLIADTEYHVSAQGPVSR